MQQYTCSQCNGRSGEIIPFGLPDDLDIEPSHCPFCGSLRHVKPLDEYLEQYENLDDYERFRI